MVGDEIDEDLKELIPQYDKKKSENKSKDDLGDRLLSTRNSKELEELLFGGLDN